MFKVNTNQTISLAGLYQSLALVQQIAWQGEIQHANIAPSLQSILKLNVDDFIQPYGSIQNLKLGLQALRQTLEKRNDTRVLERTRYAVNLMYLENKLHNNGQVLSALGREIERIQSRYSNVDEDSLSDISQELGELYRDYISPLGAKIIVQGNPEYLKIDHYASSIRALLLAGIRAIVLWRQAEGKRWTLLFGRDSILKNIETLEQSI